MKKGRAKKQLTNEQEGYVLGLIRTRIFIAR